jgi:hypothetical protein
MQPHVWAFISQPTKRHNKFNYTICQYKKEFSFTWDEATGSEGITMLGNLKMAKILSNTAKQL